MPISVWGRGDNSNAANASLNVSNKNTQPTTLLTFSADTNDDGIDDGDLKLDFTLDGSIDPDTVIYLDTNGDGILDSGPITFTMEFGGTFPNANKINGVGPNNTDLRGEEVLILTLEDGSRFFILRSLFFDPDGPNAATESQDSFDIMDDIPNGAINLNGLFVCYVAGTEILTTTGLKNVEDLADGDQVLADKGQTSPVLYIATKTYAENSIRAFAGLRPILIPRNTLGGGEPETDLKVSPQHRILIRDSDLQILFGLDAAFVAAKDLPFARPSPIETTTYVHFLCEHHSVVRANGCESETLFPGDVALLSMSAQARDEIAKIIGDSRDQKTAYPCLTSKEATVWREAVQRREKRTA